MLKLKTQKTTHPVWQEHVELYVSFVLQAHPPSPVHSNEHQALQMQILEGKVLMGTATVLPEETMKLTQTFKEMWLPIVPDKHITISCTIKPQLRLRMKIVPGSASKKTKKIEQTGTHSFKRSPDPRIPELLHFVRTDDLISLEDYVLFHPSSNEVNAQHPKTRNTVLHECCLENKEYALLLLLSVRTLHFRT